MSTRLTDTSYAVLGLIDRDGPSTPYQLKQTAQSGLLYFWTIPHTQIYLESARLTEAGLLEETQEDGGRRRRVYRLTPAGRAELARWRDDPTTNPREIRDPALLKLFLGSEPVALARDQLATHQRRLDAYVELQVDDMPEPARRVLEAGIAQERTYVRFWRAMTEA